MTLFANELNVFFKKTDKAPYHIHSDGFTLSTFNNAVMGQLLKNESGYQLEPGLIEYYKFDFKREIYILKLRENILFHNGRTANSVDLEFSLLRGFYSPDRSFFHVYLGNLEGIESIKPGDKFRSGAISGIKIIDNLTIEVKLKKPNPSFFHSLTNAYFSLFPIEELQDDYLTWKTVPIGAGNYKVIGNGFDGKKTTIVSIFKSDKDKRPKIVHFHNEKNDRVDIFEDYTTAPEGFIKYKTDKAASVLLMSISNMNELSKNSDFRKGLSFLIDRSEIESENSGKVSSSQILPSHFWGRDRIKSMYDLEKAKMYFSRIPKELLDKKYNVLMFSGSDLNEEQKRIAFILEKQFSKVGFNAKFIASTKKFIDSELASSSPLLVSGRVCDYVDPLVMFASFRKNGHAPFYSPTGKNLDEYERLYVNASNADNFDDRNKSVQDLSRFIESNIIAIPIAEAKILLNVRKSKVKSLGKQTNPITLNLENIEMY